MRRTMALVAMALAAGYVLAAQPAKPASPRERGEVVLSWEEFVKITGYDPARKGGQVITIPWSEVEDLLGVKVEPVGKATTVNLPWTEFKALLQWSIQRKAGKAPPPTDFVVSSSQYTGTAGDESAQLGLNLKLEILREEGWKRIPLLSSKVALTNATLPEGVFLNATGEAYELLTQKTGAVEVTVEFSVAVEEEAGIRRLTFPRVAPGACVLDLAIPREDVEVEVAGAQSQIVKTAKGQSRVAAALPPGTTLSVSWERALPEVAKLPPKLYAETGTLVAIAEGVLLCQETVNFNILHTGVRELRLKVPDQCSVLTVTGTKVEDWRSDGKGELTVVLRGEVVGATSVSLTFERPAADSVEVPVVRAVGVEREKGFVGVVAVANVELQAGQVTGARTIDVRQLPADLVAMTKQPVLLGFRYIGEQVSIALTIKRHGEVSVLVTIVDSALFAAMQLDDGRRMTKVVYSVRNNRNQFLRLKLPQGAELWSVEVSGNTVAPAKDDDGNVLVPLIRSARGATELAAFPVDIVYVETPGQPAPTSGQLRAELPVVNAPVMHLMFNYYLPAEGRYESWLGGSRFSGPLKRVEEFTALATERARVVQRDTAQQVAQMQKQVQARADRAAAAAGATPIRVRLPINGKLFKFEKILVLPRDELWVAVKYSGWKPAR